MNILRLCVAWSILPDECGVNEVVCALRPKYEFRYPLVKFVCFFRRFLIVPKVRISTERASIRTFWAMTVGWQLRAKFEDVNAMEDASRRDVVMRPIGIVLYSVGITKSRIHYGSGLLMYL